MIEKNIVDYDTCRECGRELPEEYGGGDLEEWGVIGYKQHLNCPQKSKNARLIYRVKNGITNCINN